MSCTGQRGHLGRDALGPLRAAPAGRGIGIDPTHRHRGCRLTPVFVCTQAPACTLLYERQNQRRSALYAATTPNASIIADDDDDAVLEEDEEAQEAAAGAGVDGRRPMVRSLAPVVQRALAQRYHQRMMAQHTHGAPGRAARGPG